MHRSSRRRQTVAAPWPSFLVLLLFLALPIPTNAAISFCKCMCFSNYTIVPLYRPRDPSKPCLSCTKQFCLDQKLAICQDAHLPDTNPDTGTGEGGDVRTVCFERDSARDQAIVISFILITGGLLAGAAFKQRGASWYEAFQHHRRRMTGGGGTYAPMTS